MTIKKRKIGMRDHEMAVLKEEIALLRKSEEKYRTIFEALPVSIQVTDKDGIITEVNPFHVEHIGKGRTTERDYLDDYIVTRPSIVQAGLSELYRSVLDGKSIDEKEVYFPSTTGGTHAYYNVKGVPLRRDDQTAGAVFIVEDVTELKKARDELLTHQKKLEEMIEARTSDLTRAYHDLQAENSERKKTEAEKERLIDELKDALGKVKTLSGFIPICASCKKIRDDKGFWRQIELYLREHSDAEFTHGICPDCVKKLYPQIAKNMNEQET